MRLFRLPTLSWELPEERDLMPVVAPAGSDPFAGWAEALVVIAPVVPPAAESDDGGVVLVDLVGEVEAHAKASGTVALTPVATASLTALRTSYTSGAAGAYNVTINFTGTWTSALQDVFVAAANRISAVIVGDLPNVSIHPAKAAAGKRPAERWGQLVFLAILVRAAFLRLAMRPRAILRGSSSISFGSQSSRYSETSAWSGCLGSARASSML